jgi:hypothetical protein
VDDTIQLSRAAERLISRHVNSAGALDLLLLLHGTRDREWELHELCEALRCPERWATGQLRKLGAVGLVAVSTRGRYRYERGRQYGPAADELARACRRDRAAVTRLIFARPSRPGAR